MFLTCDLFLPALQMYQRIFGTISLPLVFPMIRWRAASMDLAMDVPLEPLIVPMTVWGLGLCNTVMFPVYSWSFAMNHSKIIWFHVVQVSTKAVFPDFPTHGIPCRHALVFAGSLALRRRAKVDHPQDLVLHYHMSSSARDFRIDLWLKPSETHRIAYG